MELFINGKLSVIRKWAREVKIMYNFVRICIFQKV